MQHNKLNNKSPLIGIAAVLLFVGTIVALIILIKNSSTKEFDEEGQLIKQDTPTVAYPEIDKYGTDYDAPTLIPDTLMGTDGRTLTDAGYEDGYWAGFDDAHLGQERASYDESYTNAATQQERTIYAQNYREGYDEGWACGLNDRKAMDQKAETDKMPEKVEHH